MSMRGSAHGPGDSGENLDSMVSELNLNQDGSRADSGHLDAEYIPGSGSHENDEAPPDLGRGAEELQYHVNDEPQGGHHTPRSAAATLSPADRIKALLAELPVALQGKSEKVSRNQALVVIAAIIAVPAFLFFTFSPKPKAAPVAVVETPATPRPAAATTLLPKVSTKPPVAAAPLAMAVPAPVPPKVEAAKPAIVAAAAAALPVASPPPAVTAGWKPTTAGLDANVERILGDGGSQKPVSPTAPALTPADSPLPQGVTTQAGHPEALVAEAQQAQILKDMGDLKTGMEDIRKVQGAEANSIDELSGRVGSLEGQVKAVTSQVGDTQAQLQSVQAVQKQVETDTRPQLLVETVTTASGCASCSSVATATYQGEQITLADGDTFLGFIVKLDANRVILTKGSTVYTYMPEVSVP